MASDGYIFGRAHGLMGKVLTPSQIDILLSAKDLRELQAAFQLTSYGEIVKGLNFITEMSTVAKRLKNHFARIVSDFYKQGNADSKEKISLFSQRFHAENIRYILRGLYMQQNENEIIERITPISSYTYDYYKKLLSSSIPEIIASQKDKKFKARLETAYDEFEKVGKFVVLDSAIDQYEYQQLPTISPHYKLYVRLRNILWICRCIAMDIPPYRYILPNNFLSPALDKKTISEVLNQYNYDPYRKIFSQFLDEEDVPLHELEFAVERYLVKTWRKIFRVTPASNLDFIIAFFELKFAEVSDLIRIIVGINANFSKKDIKDSLLFY